MSLSQRIEVPTKKLLIVEDNVLTCKALTRHFEQFAEIDTAVTTDEAYRKMRWADVALMDGAMPTLTDPNPDIRHTLELLARLRREGDKTFKAACSKMYNKVLIDAGCLFEIEFEGLDGRINVEGLRRTIHYLLNTFQFYNPDQFPSSPPLS